MAASADETPIKEATLSARRLIARSEMDPRALSLPAQWSRLLVWISRKRFLKANSASASFPLCATERRGADNKSVKVARPRIFASADTCQLL
jgi:hypothetical protein